ncbi:hypothetical protein EDF46_2769 [Frondihabitans sp. PhB188]|uniref:hypothetical protein n=1 Tax=Frondihabitans sp. PhB188 TaxID=2485200 RepID=UPI000F4781C3|nr:hypothetical protein [Frondihabitans sp. PhB188]ROQ37313.1 hypothetical protein EDF46_2769 [Frondihabitans sp. PhB188]
METSPTEASRESTDPHDGESDRSAVVPSSSWVALDEAVDRENRLFDGDLARRAGVTETVITDFATGWVAAGNRAENSTLDAKELMALQGSELTVLACAGKNRVDHTGLQYNYYLNSCNTSKLVSAIAVGAGAAAIAAVIMAATGVGAVAAGIVAGALTIAGGVIGMCSSKGRGIVAHIIQYTNVVWCNNQ